MPEKRDTARVPLPGEVTGEVTVFQPMAILEMSEGGARVETTFPLHLDSLHHFRLTLGDHSVVVQGRIVHSEIARLREGTALYRTGVEFVEPSEYVHQAILAFVDAMRAARRVPAILDADLADDGA